MRIDGTHGLDPNAPAEGQNAPARNTPKTASASPEGGVDGSQILAAQREVIAQARRAEKVDLQAVEEARRLIASGELDTPEAARRAAQAIIELGL